MRILATCAALAILWSTTQANIPQQAGESSGQPVLLEASVLLPTPDNPDDEGPSDDSSTPLPTPDNPDDEGPSDDSSTPLPTPDNPDDEGPSDD